MVGTVSSATLRGVEDEMSAPPREFQAVHSNNMESASTHHNENRIALENCNSDEELLQVTFIPDKHSDGDNQFTISIKQNDKWNKLAKKSGELEETFTLCLSPGYHRFEAIDSHSDGILDDGYYKVSLGGRTIFQSPDGKWSRVVHKFDVLGSSYNNDKTTDDDDNDKEEPEAELLAMMPQATEFPTMVLASAPNSSPSSPTTKNPTPRPTTKTPTPRPTTNEPSLLQTTLEPILAIEEMIAESSTQESTTDAPTSKPSRRPSRRPTAEVTSVANVSTGEMTERDEQWLEEHNVRREF